MQLRTKILAFVALPLLLLGATSYALDSRVAEALVRSDAEQAASAWMWRVRYALEEVLRRDAIDVGQIEKISSELSWSLDTDLLAQFDGDRRLIDCYRRTADMGDGRSLLAAWVEPLDSALHWLDVGDGSSVAHGYVELDGRVLGLVIGRRASSDLVTVIGRWIDRKAIAAIPVATGVLVEMQPRGVTLPSERQDRVHIRSDEKQLLFDRRTPGRVSVYTALSDPSGMVAGYLRVEFAHRVAELIPRVMHASALAMILLWSGGIGLVFWFLHRSGLCRLSRMVAAVHLIQEDDKGRCLVPIEYDDELGRLGEAVNTFVKRLRIDALEVERLARAKTEFLATMSHEIRTPMTALSGYADVLMDEAVSAEERMDAVGTIHRNGFHLLAVLNEILDLTHVEDGDPEIALQACEPRELVLGVKDLSRMRADARGLCLTVDVDPEVPLCVEFDPMRVRQVLLNLVGNALKFTVEGGVRLVVRLDSSKAVSRLLFEVEDSGVGMNEEQLSRVFAPYQQADSSTQRRFGGTGLGLNISRRIAELHGGTLTASSDPGVGTCFTFAIELRRVESQDLAAQGDEEMHGNGAAGTNLKILLCESVQETRMLLASQLRSAGMAVSLATDALSACQGALRSRHDFDVIVLDMQSSESDACVMAQLLRQSDFGGAILALTASPSVEERSRCLAAGCDDYLFKPFLQLEFVSVLMRLGRSDAGRNRAKRCDSLRQIAVGTGAEPSCQGSGSIPGTPS